MEQVTLVAWFTGQHFLNIITSCNFLRLPLDSTGNRCNIKKSLPQDDYSESADSYIRSLSSRRSKTKQKEKSRYMLKGYRIQAHHIAYYANINYCNQKKDSTLSIDNWHPHKTFEMVPSKHFISAYFMKNRTMIGLIKEPIYET